jgi:signal transduction histidine kinase
MMKGGARTKVLIVEDSLTQAQKLAEYLVVKGFSVRTAVDGAAGAAAIHAHPPDIVISDILMPDLDGYELCRRIKADTAVKDTPIILLTSLSDPQAVIRGLECGADGFIIKTGSDAPVLEAVERLLHPHEPGPAMAHQSADIRVRIAGEDHRMTAQPQRIFDFLISTYEAAFRSNEDLLQARDELALLNGQLEARVKERTEELARRNQEVSATYQQLWQAEKLATLGELTASVAHELNNPLQTVSLHIESLARRFSHEPDVGESIDVVEKELDRMAHLVQNLLQLGRKGAQRVVTVNAAEELEKTVELLHYHLRARGVVAKKDFRPGTPLIRVDPEQLQQAFLNILTNACDAMPSGGDLTLRVQNGVTVIIEIIDSGTGIAADDLPRVLETFFTTKPPGKGTGLGLPISKRIVEAYNGSLSIESELGRGTSVRLAFPAVGAEEMTYGQP